MDAHQIALNSAISSMDSLILSTRARLDDAKRFQDDLNKTLLDLHEATSQPVMVPVHPGEAYPAYVTYSPSSSRAYVTRRLKACVVEVNELEAKIQRLQEEVTSYRQARDALT